MTSPSIKEKEAKEDGSLYVDSHCCEGEEEDSRNTASSPLVLEPLGMSITFPDDEKVNDDEVAKELNFDEDDNWSRVDQNSFTEFMALWRIPILVYSLCFVLPTVSSFVMHEDTIKRFRDMLEYIHRVMYDGILCGSVCTAWKERIRHEYIEPALEYICNLDDEYLVDWQETAPWRAYLSISYWAHYFNLCPSELEEEEPVIRYRSVVATDVSEWKNDLAIVIAIGATLTALRFMVVVIATQISSIGRSREEDFLARSTVDNYSIVTSPSDATFATAKQGDATNVIIVTTESDESQHDSIVVVDSPTGDSTDATTLPQEVPPNEHLSLPENKSADLHPSDDVTATTEASDPLFMAISVEASLPGSALFRTLCCTVSAIIAWQWFHKADFWPDFLLGHGQLDHCWDLVIESDESEQEYQELNTLLRYYVLIQASYHVHSVAFRFVRWLIRRKRRTSLIVSLIQSVTVLGLLLLAYSLSSLRRLLAIGMFALDVSTAICHFWRLCAPSTTVVGTVRKTFLRFLYWGLVMPSFLITRFYVYPVLWESAVKAHEWRTHVEQDLWKISAEQMERLCYVCIVLLSFVSVLALHRLLVLGPLAQGGITR